jgi:hypothetical protein
MEHNPQTSCSFPYFIKVAADWKDIWSKNAANAATRGDSRLCQRKRNDVQTDGCLVLRLTPRYLRSSNPFALLSDFPECFI